jgi:hypothetical protein
MKTFTEIEYRGHLWWIKKYEVTYEYQTFRYYDYDSFYQPITWTQEEKVEISKKEIK